MELANSNYLKMLIDGKRRLTRKLAEKMPGALGLTREEARFFLALVEYIQAETTDSRAEALRRLKRFKRFLHVHRTELEHFSYLNDPLLLTLREMVALPDFSEDVDWILAHLPGGMRRQEIEDGIAKLLSLGMIFRDDEGRLQQAKQHIATGDLFGYTPLRKHHLSMLELAGKAMDQPADTRYFRGLTMTLSPESYQRIVEEYSCFIDRVRSIVDADEACSEVYHMHTSLFPMTRPKRSEDPEKK